jgi:hypothetical protein
LGRNEKYLADSLIAKTRPESESLSLEVFPSFVSTQEHNLAQKLRKPTSYGLERGCNNGRWPEWNVPNDSEY